MDSLVGLGRVCCKEEKREEEEGIRVRKKKKTFQPMNSQNVQDKCFLSNHFCICLGPCKVLLVTIINCNS